MSLTCAISNEIPQDPVLSTVSGHMFERRLIEKYIQTNGTDPINGHDLSIDQLVSIKSTPVMKARAAQTASIPSLLKICQDEWDAVLLQCFTARQQLQATRQELSHALYQHDAACRVIARLSKEVTAAREALATLKPHVGQPQHAEPMYAEDAGTEAEQPEGMTDEVIAKLTEKAAVLTAARKQRGKQLPDNLTKAEQMKEFKQTDQQIGLHSAGAPGILALDIHAADDALIVTAGADKHAVVYDRRAQKIVATLKGHTKKVTRVIYHPSEPLVVTAAHDNTVRVWSVREERCAHIIQAHTGAVTGISLHATGDYVLSVGMDKKWAFSDIRSGRTLCSVTDPNDQPITCAQFHPDGLIFGTGLADSIVKIWDLKDQTNVANFPGHTGAIGSIAFSENGYYLATAAEDATVKLWDLRKLKNFKTIQLDDEYVVRDLCFDQSGTYLAVCGGDVRVYLCKQWTESAILREHTDAVTGVRFGTDATFVASCGLDRALRFYGLPRHVQV